MLLYGGLHPGQCVVDIRIMPSLPLVKFDRLCLVHRTSFALDCAFHFSLPPGQAYSPGCIGLLFSAEKFTELPPFMDAKSF